MDRTVVYELPADDLFLAGVIGRFQHPDHFDRGLERPGDLVERRVFDLVWQRLGQGQSRLPQPDGDGCVIRGILGVIRWRVCCPVHWCYPCKSALAGVTPGGWFTV